MNADQFTVKRMNAIQQPSAESNALPAKKTRRTYPLSSLFLLTMILAIVAAIVSSSLTEIEDSLSQVALLGAISGGGVVGSVFGALVGLYHHRRLVGFFMGGLAGIVSGVLVTTINLSADLTRWPTTCLSGCILLLVSSAILRSTGRSIGGDELK